MGELKTNEVILNDIKKEYNNKKKNENPLVIKFANIHTMKGIKCKETENCKPIDDKEQCKLGERCSPSIFDTSYKTLENEMTEIKLSNINNTINSELNFIETNTTEIEKNLTTISNKINHIGRYYYTENKKIDTMISTNLDEKNKKIERKKQKYMLEYNKIEELDQEINKKRKKINYYLNMLKYLIPILIIFILIKILI